jgi:hypothetical protein
LISTPLSRTSVFGVLVNFGEMIWDFSGRTTGAVAASAPVGVGVAGWGLVGPWRLMISRSIGRGVELG